MTCSLIEFFFLKYRCWQNIQVRGVLWFATQAHLPFFPLLIILRRRSCWALQLPVAGAAARWLLGVSAERCCCVRGQLWCCVLRFGAAAAFLSALHARRRRRALRAAARWTPSLLLRLASARARKWARTISPIRRNRANPTHLFFQAKQPGPTRPNPERNTRHLPPYAAADPPPPPRAPL